MTPIRIDVCERAKRDGVFEARIDGELVCIDRVPFLTAARVLLERGHDPQTQIVMVTAWGTESLRSTIGAAAKLRVEENENCGPRFGKYRPFEGGAFVAGNGTG